MARPDFETLFLGDAKDIFYKRITKSPEGLFVPVEPQFRYGAQNGIWKNVNNVYRCGSGGN